MSTNAIKAQGTTLGLGSGSPVSYTTIAEIKNFNGPSGGPSVIDVTDLSSTAKEKVAGLNDNGQLSFECNFVPGNTQHEALKTAKENGSIVQIQLTFSNAVVWTFSALVTNISVSGGVDGVVTASVTLEITGDISVS